MRRRDRHDRGAAAVEFALVLVPLVTLIFGVIQYGYYFYQSHSAAASAREGARLAAVGVTSCASFKTALDSRTTGITLTSYALSYPDGRQVGKTVKVDVVYTPTKFGFPFLPFISGNKTETGKARTEVLVTGGPTTC
jgi:Flp pilus assembly protein TadG